jgi:hypothetical protein
MLDVIQFGDLRLRGRVAAKLVCDDLAWHRARKKHSPKEAFGGGLVAPLLQQDVELGAMFIKCTP